MDMGLKGTVALVTASSSGLGKATALALAQEGACVAICARRADILEAAAEEIRQSTGADTLAVPADLSRVEDIERVVSATVQRWGRLDILVNNAGGPPQGEFTEHDEAAWYRTFEVNLMSAVRLIRESLPYLKASGRGRIINFTSLSVRQPVERLILSNSIRLAVVGMAKTLSRELAPYNITVNNIAPGRIATARIRELDRTTAARLGITEEEAARRETSTIPMGRYGSPEEVAALAVFLASDKAAYITGTTIQVDGGLINCVP